MSNASLALPVARTMVLPSDYILNPVDAYRLTIGTYFTIGALSVFIWDTFFNLQHDYQLVRADHTCIASAIYFVSRVSTLAFALMETILLTMPIQDCRRYQVATIFFYNLFIASTMLLSYFRVCAVWNRNSIIKGLFGFLWFAGFCGSLTSAAGIVSSHWPKGSPYCTERTAGEFVAAAILGPLVNHFSVFVAITYGVCRTCAGNHDKLTIRAGYRVFVLGESLPAFSKAILQTCQLCYLAAMLSGVAAVIWFYVFSSNPSYRLAMFVPYAVAVNIMFSWVFRKGKLGMCAMSGRFTDRPVCPSTLAKTSEPCTLTRERSPTCSSNDSIRGSPIPVEINIHEVVESKTDYPNPEDEKGVDTFDVSFTV
ncbi:hypothetical protein GALMADRAFT_147530 [Galerina marginata CBS 339.88]|uniref:G-protein coupled receptors family 1 profile domain-containing protein n=1 Tax=Galerina marginata (strain CBS 339.88) TaxID=685588 RepID=A0A067SGL8_GALM3|nr:hypothetical protein GALMADRAFT_147530 [Galerina marginata CBS 339.88]